MNFKKSMLTAACAVALGAVTAPAMAADWLMLQGTEEGAAAGRAYVWGFIQAQYQRNESDATSVGPDTGKYVPPKLVGPNLTSQQAFNVNRARIGVRGVGMPIAPDVNYFLLAEFGNNAITAPGNAFAKITDASITLNQFKNVARVRAGLFKTPMSEELYNGIAVFDYVNFTWGGNQLLLERLPNPGRATNNIAPQKLPTEQSLNGFTQSVAGARDTGIQFFNTVPLKNNWELGWSVMFGNGNGLNFSDNNDKKDTYLYANLTKVFGGKGPKREDMKMFAWYQGGERTGDFDFTDTTGGVSINDNGTPADATDDYPVATGDGVDDSYTPTTHDRKRYGVGIKMLKKPFRFTAEYIKAEGMIFQGPDKPLFDLNGGGAANKGSGLDGKADSWYVEGGWYIPKTNWELDARYDVLNRLTGDKMEIQFTSTTLGVQYHFNKKTRATFNYEIRDAEAVNFATSGAPSGMGPNMNLNGVGNNMALQITHIF